MKNIILVFILMFNFNAMAKDQLRPITVVVDVENILKNTSLSAEQKSDLLTQQAEWLLLPDNYFFSYEIFQKAVQLNPRNIKAQIYVHTYAPFMELKGILSKLSKLATASPEAKAEYLKIKTTLAKGDANQTEFFLQKSQPFSSEKDLQTVLQNIFAQMLESRDFLRSLKGKNVPALNMHQDFSTESNNEAYYDYETSRYNYDEGSKDTKCTTKKENGRYTLENCSVLDRVMIKVDTIDLDIIEAKMNFALVGLVLATSYDLSGAVQSHFENSKLQDSMLGTKEINLKKQQALEKLLRNPEFGKLLSNNQIRSLRLLSGEALISLKSILSIPKEVCDKAGSFGPSKRSRSGKLFGNVCVTGRSDSKNTALPEFISGLDSLISSGSGYLPLYASSPRNKTFVNFNTANPIQDVRDLGIQISSCGQVKFTKDSTLSGLFPNGDINKVTGADEACPR